MTPKIPPTPRVAGCGATSFHGPKRAVHAPAGPQASLCPSRRHHRGLGLKRSKIGPVLVNNAADRPRRGAVCHSSPAGAGRGHPTAGCCRCACVCVCGACVCVWSLSLCLSVLGALPSAGRHTRPQGGCSPGKAAAAAAAAEQGAMRSQLERAASTCPRRRDVTASACALPSAAPSSPSCRRSRGGSSRRLRRRPRSTARTCSGRNGRTAAR